MCGDLKLHPGIPHLQRAFPASVAAQSVLPGSEISSGERFCDHLARTVTSLVVPLSHPAAELAPGWHTSVAAVVAPQRFWDRTVVVSSASAKPATRASSKMRPRHSSRHAMSSFRATLVRKAIAMEPVRPGLPLLQPSFSAAVRDDVADSTLINKALPLAQAGQTLTQEQRCP